MSKLKKIIFSFMAFICTFSFLGCQPTGDGPGNGHKDGIDTIPKLWSEIEGTKLEWIENPMWDNSSIHHYAYNTYSYDAPQEASLPNGWFAKEENLDKGDNNPEWRRLFVSLGEYNESESAVVSYNRTKPVRKVDYFDEVIKINLQGVEAISDYSISGDIVDMRFVFFYEEMKFTHLFAYRYTHEDIIGDNHNSIKSEVIEHLRDLALKEFEKWVDINISNSRINASKPNTRPQSWDQIEAEGLMWVENQIWDDSDINQHNYDTLEWQGAVQLPNGWIVSESKDDAVDNVIVGRSLEVSLGEYSEGALTLVPYLQTKPDIQRGCVSDIIPEFMNGIEYFDIQDTQVLFYYFDYFTSRNKIDLSFEFFYKGMFFTHRFVYKHSEQDKIFAGKNTDGFDTFVIKPEVLEHAKDLALAEFENWLANLYKNH